MYAEIRAGVRGEGVGELREEGVVEVLHRGGKGRRGRGGGGLEEKRRRRAECELPNASQP